jgi:UDPglucose--hexose-1-phosphate uridylyltransferase
MTERRRNLLTGDWVLVSTGRLQRPWQGGEEPDAAVQVLPWDRKCHLCPRVARASGETNPDYRGIYQFANDFPALAPDAMLASGGGLLERESVTGTCEVLCYSPRHDLTLATMPTSAVTTVVDAWRDATQRLAADHAWVQLFENKGAAMGASSSHPHGQVWAMSVLPSEAVREDQHQRTFQDAHQHSLLDDYANTEMRDDARVVLRVGSWLAVVPYWAAWPFEVLVVCLSPCTSMVEISDVERDDLAVLLGRLLRAYDGLFGVSFPYSMGWHGLPAPGPGHWRLHAHFYPPLLRSATVRKFMVGFELLSEVQRDLSPEEAASRLRAAMPVA